MEVGIILPLVLTTSCGEREREREEGEEGEKGGRGKNGKGEEQDGGGKTLNVRYTSLLVQIHSKLISVYQSSCVVWRGRVELRRV